MIIPSTELKTNLGKYLDLLDDEGIVITRNGRKIARLVKEEDDTVSEVRSLFGILAGSPLAGTNDEEVKNAIHEERGKRYDSVD